MCQLPASPTPTPDQPVVHQPGSCPHCGHELYYAGGAVQDEQYSYDWQCHHCQARGKEWYRMEFDGHTLASGEAVQLPTKQRMTVIGEYWDNEQGYQAQVLAADKEEAVRLAQAECAAGLAAEGGEAPDPEEAEGAPEPLRIWAVLKGWPDTVFLKSEGAG